MGNKGGKNKILRICLGKNSKRRKQAREKQRKKKDRNYATPHILILIGKKRIRPEEKGENQDQFSNSECNYSRTEKRPYKYTGGPVSGKKGASPRRVRRPKGRLPFQGIAAFGERRAYGTFFGSQPLPGLRLPRPTFFPPPPRQTFSGLFSAGTPLELL
jgi:hypothetical protein